MTSEPTLVRAYVGAGSNIEPQRNLRAALDAVEKVFGELEVSSVYRTRAVGFEGDDFLNLVLSFETNLPPADVIAELDRVESEAGRQREGEKFGPRTLDLDLLLYGDRVEEALKLPRADIVEYAFVLGPLAEMAPDLRHPATGVTMQALWADFDEGDEPISRLTESL